MASQDLKQRHKYDPTTTAAADSGGVNSSRSRRSRKLAMAKRGLRSLTVAVAAPLALAVLTAWLTGAAYADARGRPFWHPPPWAFHLASASTACLMGLSAWLVWAEGGFHRQPAALPLYVAQLALSLAWGPLVFGMGATRAGLVVSVALLAVLGGCSQCFRRVNPIAGDLVKPCIAWVLFLALFNYKLV